MGGVRLLCRGTPFAVSLSLGFCCAAGREMAVLRSDVGDGFTPPLCVATLEPDVGAVVDRSVGALVPAERSAVLGGGVVIRGFEPVAGAIDVCVFPTGLRVGVCAMEEATAKRTITQVEKRMRMAKFISIERLSVDKCNNSRTENSPLVTQTGGILKEL